MGQRTENTEVKEVMAPSQAIHTGQHQDSVCQTQMRVLPTFSYRKFPAHTTEGWSLHVHITHLEYQFVTSLISPLPPNTLHALPLEYCEANAKVIASSLYFRMYLREIKPSQNASTTTLWHQTQNSKSFTWPPTGPCPCPSSILFPINWPFKSNWSHWTQVLALTDMSHKTSICRFWSDSDLPQPDL